MALDESMVAAGRNASQSLRKLRHVLSIESGIWRGSRFIHEAGLVKRSTTFHHAAQMRRIAISSTISPASAFRSIPGPAPSADSAMKNSWAP
jgi:hypothetical protein